MDYYDIIKDEWKVLEPQLNTVRSESSACVFNDTTIYISGGYNKEAGTLGSIEKFDIALNKIIPIEVKMPTPLRLFASVKISNTKILFLGGSEKVGRDTDSVYCFDNEIS